MSQFGKLKYIFPPKIDGLWLPQECLSSLLILKSSGQFYKIWLIFTIEFDAYGIKLQGTIAFFYYSKMLFAVTVNKKKKMKC